MTDVQQLALVDLDPVVKLTDRQQATLDALTAAGPDGLDADQAGALLCERKGIHHRDARCQFCGLNGKGVLEALKSKGLARYRRRTTRAPGVWLASTVEGQPQGESRDGDRLQDGWDDLIRLGF